MDAILRDLKRILDAVSEERTERFLRAIREARRVFMYGVGRSGLVARMFGMRLVHLGRDATIVGDTTTPAIRQGDLLMGDKRPEQGDHYFDDRDRIVVPSQPRRLDFVMVPAASIEGELLDQQGQPMADKQLWIQGKQMRPSSSVLAGGKTDPQGRFRFDAVPPGYPWWFTIRDQGRTQPITFPGRGGVGDLEDTDHSHDRDRGRPGLRRPGPGDPRPPRPDGGVQAEVREALRGPRLGYLPGGW